MLDLTLKVFNEALITIIKLQYQHLDEKYGVVSLTHNIDNYPQ